VLPKSIYIKPKKVRVKAISLEEDLSKPRDLGKE